MLYIMNIFNILFILLAMTIRYSNSNIETIKNRFITSIQSIKKWSIISGTAAIIFANHPDVFALSSGSRVGGSSFRSSSQTQTKSFNSPRYNTRVYSSMYIPSYSYSYSYTPVNFDILALTTVSYVVFQVFSNRMSDFLDETSVIKLQVGMDSDWSKAENIIENLNSISTNTNINSLGKRSDIADMLSTVSLILLRKENDWNSVAYESKIFDTKNDRKAELYFQKLAIMERSKYDKEIIPTPSKIQDNHTNSSSKTQVVVSLIVAIKGRSDAYLKNHIITISELHRCLQSFAYESLADSGENIIALELSWTPSERNTMITEKDLPGTNKIIINVLTVYYYFFK